MTKFTAFRDIVRGMTDEDRALLAAACCLESAKAAEARQNMPAHYAWNTAHINVNAAASASENGGQDG